MNIGKVTQVGKSWEEIVRKYGEVTILEHYVPNIKKLPCLISCPYRKDKNPSFGLKMIEDHIIFKDFATGESGGLLSLIKNITGKTKKDIIREYSNNVSTSNICIPKNIPKKEIPAKFLNLNKITMNQNIADNIGK